MKRLESGVLFLMAACLAGGSVLAEGPARPQAKPHHPHAAEISVYQGSKTCAECHEEALKDVAVSLHYQQAADAPNLEGWPAGKKAGMLFNY